ncbi:MAG TPA: hypothetical protein VI030_02900 [Propionibacteriaceae bacterium]
MTGEATEGQLAALQAAEAQIAQERDRREDLAATFEAVECTRVLAGRVVIIVRDAPEVRQGSRRVEHDRSRCAVLRAAGGWQAPQPGQQPVQM